MRSYIKAVVIFDSKGEKRFVDFNQGVNIITGDSKTGKSALLEIIDYCLCSSRCTIPKGTITEFGNMYCLLFVIRESCLIIARESWEKGGKMYFDKQNGEFSHENLEYSYFNNKTFLPPKDVQFLIENELDLKVSNLGANDEEKNGKKASLRNMTSYMFQHQNLMASKFALFYRFTDYYKRQDVIEQFPVFAGIVGQEYYSSLIKLTNLRKDLKRLQKTELQNKDISQIAEKGILPLLKDYFALTNSTLDENQNIKDLIELSKNLPPLELEIHTSKDIVERYTVLNDKLEKLRSEECELNLKINELKSVNSVSFEYRGMLNELFEKTNISTAGKDQYTCPLCGNECHKITKISNDVIEASKWLDNEIKISNSYSYSFVEDIRKLEEEKDKVIKDIKEVYRQLKYIERNYMQSENLKNLEAKVNNARARIELYVESLNEEFFKGVSKEISEITGSIKQLEQNIKDYDIEKRKNTAKYKILENMGRIAQTLDFEEEFRPMNLVFDLDTFDLYHLTKTNQKIYLSEMGSGANWVSCHISLFLSLLRYFSEQKEKSPMPLILFLDQPSQVYFPQGTDPYPDREDELKTSRQKDIEAVNNIYKTIFDEVESISNDVEIIPQVIIVDHVDGEELAVKEVFKRFQRRNWRNGKALI